MGLRIEVPIIRRHLHLSDPMIRVRWTRGESQERGRVLVVGRRCQCCVSSAYLAWLAKVMKDQCIHLLCTLQCRSTVPSWLAGWLAYLEGSAEQPFSAGSVPASARVVPDQRWWRALDIAFNTSSVGEWEPALSAGIQVSISITCNQIRG